MVIKVTPIEHCKCLQGNTGTLQGNWVTGISFLQGYHWYEISSNYYSQFESNKCGDSTKFACYRYLI